MIFAPTAESPRIHGRSFRAVNSMATKPPPPWEFFNQINALAGESGLKGEVDRSMRSLARSALDKLDVVGREEFDAQAEALRRANARVAELEAELEVLGKELEALAGKA